MLFMKNYTTLVFFVFTILFVNLLLFRFVKSEDIASSSLICKEKYGETAFYENGNCFYCESKNSYRDISTGRCTCDNGYVLDKNNNCVIGSDKTCIEKYGSTAIFKGGRCDLCDSENMHRENITNNCVCNGGYGYVGDKCVPALDFCIHNYGTNVIVKENNCRCDFGYILNKDNKCDMAINVCRDNFGSEYTFYNGKCIHKNDVAKNQRISSDQKYNSYMFVFTLVGIFLSLTSIVLIRKFIFKKNSKKFIKIILYVVGAYIVLYVSNMVWILFE